RPRRALCVVAANCQGPGGAIGPRINRATAIADITSDSAAAIKTAAGDRRRTGQKAAVDAAGTAALCDLVAVHARLDFGLRQGTVMYGRLVNDAVPGARAAGVPEDARVRADRPGHGAIELD